MNPPGAGAGSGLIICAGLYGSGSTWCYNVARDLMVAAAGVTNPDTTVLGLYAEDLTEAVEAAMLEHLPCIIKSHILSPGLRVLARMTDAPVLLSLRDPRDCIVSMMERFGWSFEKALGNVTRSARSLLDWLRTDQALILRYEDGFTGDPSSIGRIAAHLGQPADALRDAAVVENMDKERVAARIAARFGTSVPPAQAEKQFDTVSHWHPGHVGDGRIGKFASRLTPEEIALVEQSNWRLMRQFGYATISPVGLAPGEAVHFAAGEAGPSLLIRGFRPAESWGTWMQRPIACLEVPLRDVTTQVSLDLDFYCGAALSEGRGVIAVIGGTTIVLLDPAAPREKNRVIRRRIEANLGAPRDVVPLTLCLSADGATPSAADVNTVILGLVALRRVGDSP